MSVDGEEQKSTHQALEFSLKRWQRGEDQPEKTEKLPLEVEGKARVLWLETWLRRFLRGAVSNVADASS